MIHLGRLNKLRIVKEVNFGLYLDGGEASEILLPSRYQPQKFEIDEMLEVFVYKDSEDRIIATTEVPYATVDEFAFLEVVAVDKFGAFLKWGLMKDLFVPFGEQKVKMEAGKRYIVRVYLDELTQRIAASSKIEKFLNKIPPYYPEGQEVQILVNNRTIMGYNVIINNSHSGVLYQNELFRTVEKGQALTAYIKKIRPDQKIDVWLNKPGYEKVDDLSERIIEMLHKHDGFLPFNDKSDSREIYNYFNESKKTFKKAIGNLFKKRIIIIEENGIKVTGSIKSMKN